MARLEMEAQGEIGSGGDPAKMMEIQVRQQEMMQKQEDALLDAVNRKRDRESRERLAAMKMASEVAKNPQGLGIVNQLIDPAMLNRLESNEPTLDGKQTGEI
jgi:hypothetical protein